MPIAAENRHRYPADWQEIRHAILERAGLQCECAGECGRGHLGRCPETHLQHTARPGGTHRIVLTVAHLNHTPEDSRPENLRAMCQGCHLHYDLEHHRQARLARLARNRAQLRLVDVDVAHAPQHAGPTPATAAVPASPPGPERLYSIATLDNAVRRALLDAIVDYQAAERQLEDARAELAAALAAARQTGAHAAELAQLAAISRPRLYRLLDEHARRTR
jgi:hypothetical protein